MITLVYNVLDDITYPLQNVNDYTGYNGYTKFRNGKIISSHSLLGVWLLIRAGIKVKPC